MKEPRIPIESLSRDRDSDLFAENRDFAYQGRSFASNDDPLSAYSNPLSEKTNNPTHLDRTLPPNRTSANTFDFSDATIDGTGNVSGRRSNGSGRSQGSGGKNTKAGKNTKIGKNGKPINTKVVIVKRVLLITLIVFLVSCFAVGAFVWASVKDMPEWTPNAFDAFNFASFVYDKDGNQIAQLSSDENRLHFTYDEVPQQLIDTLLAVEDQRFYKHFGFDPLRIAKGAINTIINPDKPEGGSTITTQLAKNTFITVEQRTSGGVKGVQRKVQELFLAMQIEHNYGKDDILFAYMTQTYLGHGAFGVRSAAQTYFGKELDELTPPEIALICGLPQAPGSYDPYIRPDLAKARRDLVLSVMRSHDIITEQEYRDYLEEPFTFVDEVNSGEKSIKMGSSTSEKLYPYFVDYVVNCLSDKYNLTTNQIYCGGLKIYTTVDPAAQQEAEKVMKDPANFPANAKDGSQVQGAIVVLENATGYVIAMAGGREYPEDQQLCFNRASQAKRQPGSCAKPVIVYAPALEKGGYFAGTVLDDCPTTFPNNYKPKNASGGYSGLITLRVAIRNSINIYAVKLYQQAGPEYCYNFAKGLGLEIEDSQPEFLANALGSFGVSPVEMARAYSAFPNRGNLNDVNCVTKILDSNDRLVLETELNSNKAMKESTAYIMCDLMKDVVENGTGRNAILSNWYVGGKTGTTDAAFGGSPDIWFTGFTPLYTGAVWMGFDNSDKDHTLPSGTYGGDRPARLWQKVMVKAHEGKQRQSIFSRPADVMDVQFDLFSGMIPSLLTPSDLVGTDLATPQGMPNRESDIWIELFVDSQNRLIRPGVVAGTPQIFLNMPDRPIDNWREKELPYKPPGEYSSEDGTAEDPIDNTPLVYKANSGNNGKTVTFTTTVPKNSIYKSAFIYLFDDDNKEWLPAKMVSSIGDFQYDIPDYIEDQSSYKFQIQLLDRHGETVTTTDIEVDKGS
ncbi:MAG: PBP1A family penicillin-binding protein [Peptococcaceae bacterium]|nr:PBP1A family penicillin-binding protein [Peptococcaceae bacterium]